jgi:hypothetical protein
MTTVDTSVTLPKGVGQLPQWWLDNVLHDIRDDVIRTKRQLSRRFLGLPKEDMDNEKAAIEMEKRRMDSISTQSKAAGLSNPEVEEYDASKNGDESILASLAASQRSLMGNSSDKDSANNIFNSTMTSAEKVAAVERRRQKNAESEDYGRDKLKSRKGNIKTVDTKLTNRDQYGNDSVEEAPGRPDTKVAPGRANSEGGEVASVASAKSKKSTGSSPSKSYKTEFTGVSPFDFAMQQRAREKERREKERLAKEALATHHGHSLEADRAVELKAKEQEQRRQKREAEENLKAFKAADLDKKYEVAAELKKLHLEEKQKKREADEHLKGYRER